MEQARGSQKQVSFDLICAAAPLLESCTIRSWFVLHLPRMCYWDFLQRGRQWSSRCAWEKCWKPDMEVFGSDTTVLISILRIIRLRLERRLAELQFHFGLEHEHFIASAVLAFQTQIPLPEFLAHCDGAGCARPRRREQAHRRHCPSRAIYTGIIEREPAFRNTVVM